MQLGLSLYKGHQWKPINFDSSALNLCTRLAANKQLRRIHEWRKGKVKAKKKRSVVLESQNQTHWKHWTTDHWLGTQTGEAVRPRLSDQLHHPGQTGTCSTDHQCSAMSIHSLFFSMNMYWVPIFCQRWPRHKWQSNEERGQRSELIQLTVQCWEWGWQITNQPTNTCTTQSSGGNEAEYRGQSSRA